MKYIIKNFAIDIRKDPDFEKEIAKKFCLKRNPFKNINVVKRAIDARKKNNLRYVFTLSAEAEKLDIKHPDLTNPSETDEVINYKKLSSENPFIIGMGPAGLFAALKLVENGFKPLLFDMGDCIELRTKKVEDFWQHRILDVDSNVQFGEGGAGAFSDGKLTARTKSIFSEQVFSYLIRFGADKDISIDALPHIGTDVLEKIIINIRNFLMESGCKFFYKHKLESIKVNNGLISEITINKERYQPEILIVAVGNSARDIFTEFNSKRILIENKAFAIGLRLEHPRDYINNLFYGEKNNFSISGPATYKLVSKYKNRGVYSFCMCPGGFVIPASSSEGEQVVNGMSYSARNNKFSNSAIVVTVDSNDFGNKPLSGLNFQQLLEKRSFFDYYAPYQNASDFVKNKLSKNSNENSYFLGTVAKDLNDLFPSAIINSIKHGILNFNKKLCDDNSFLKKGNLFAVETRTSSPVRIVRDNIHYNSVGIKNLYPIGEGAGYSGGIISSATDGLKVASQFI